MPRSESDSNFAGFEDGPDDMGEYGPTDDHEEETYEESPEDALPPLPSRGASVRGGGRARRGTTKANPSTEKKQKQPKAGGKSGGGGGGGGDCFGLMTRDQLLWACFGVGCFTFVLVLTANFVPMLELGPAKIGVWVTESVGTAESTFEDTDCSTDSTGNACKRARYHRCYAAKTFSVVGIIATGLATVLLLAYKKDVVPGWLVWDLVPGWCGWVTTGLFGVSALSYLILFSVTAHARMGPADATSNCGLNGLGDYGPGFGLVVFSWLCSLATTGIMGYAMYTGE